MGMDPVTVGIGAAVGGSLLGGLAGSQSTDQTQSTSSSPWGPQQPYLTYGFEQGKNAVQNALNNPVYQGQRVADLTDWQKGTLGNAITFANNSGGYSSPAFGTGFNLMNSGAGFGNNAQSLYNQYSDPNGAINAGNAYANNDGLVAAINRDATRNLYENQLPTLNKAATGSGNLNSTRAGVESAVAQRGLADRVADTRAALFDKGVNQYNQNLLNSLAANQQLSNAYTSGNSGMINAQQIGANNYDLGMNAGGTVQNQNQNLLNADMQKFNETNQNPLAYLQQYMQLVQGNYGNTTTGTSSYGGGLGGAASGALGGALGGIGILGKLGGFGKPKE